MQKRKIIIFSLLLMAVVLSGVVTMAYPGVEVYAATDAVTAYYSGITATEGTALLGQLHDLMVTTHTKYTSYNDCKDSSIVGLIDSSGTSGKIVEFYSQAEIDSTWQNGSTWNREHVWCQSLSGVKADGTKSIWGTSGGGSDLHHIRPVWNNFNSARGNTPYGNTNGGTEKYMTISGTQYLGGYVQNNVFEPIDNVKGDVARIIFYLYTHYNTYANVGGTTNNIQSSGAQSSFFGTLKFTDIVAKDSEKEALSVLLSWNELDPVDEYERNRNEQVFAIQGNRNPFIDYPDFANAIWDDSISDSLTLSKTSTVIKLGETETLRVRNSGTDAVSWSTSNSAVAVVSGGTITAVSAGQAYVYVVAGERTTKCHVTVVSDWTVDVFCQIVEEINSAKTPQERFLKIKVARIVYGNLSQSEKDSVATQYNQLQSVIITYNQQVISKNKSHNKAIEVAIISLTGGIAALKVILYVVKRNLL